MSGITIKLEPDLAAAEFVDLLIRSTLSDRRPIGDLQRIDAMLRNASIVVAARNTDGLLVGVARAISDFAYCTYLSDLAVDSKAQRTGIGKRLIEYVRTTSGPTSTLILLSAPAAESYYPRIGMAKHNSCWTLPPTGGSPGTTHSRPF